MDRVPQPKLLLRLVGLWKSKGEPRRQREQQEHDEGRREAVELEDKEADEETEERPVGDLPDKDHTGLRAGGHEGSDRAQDWWVLSKPGTIAERNQQWSCI